MPRELLATEPLAKPGAGIAPAGELSAVGKLTGVRPFPAVRALAEAGAVLAAEPLAKPGAGIALAGELSAVGQLTGIRTFAAVRALAEAGRKDLIGSGCDALIPERPPKAALEARRLRAGLELESGDHVHSTRRRPSHGYRPGRTGARKRER